MGGYRIDDIIGIGGMAIVYRAEQVALGRPVALKVLAPQLSHDEAFRERFRREGKHVAALDHPHVVPIFDSGEVDGRLYLAMRFVAGSTLAERMREGPLSREETIRVLLPIAEALDAAHAINLVHRDVKPQNILLAAGMYPYLADFGVAKAGSATLGLTSTGGFVGSINYAAPEQIRGETITPAGDIYALAAVLYQCLAGHVPYPRDTDAGVMHAHLNEPPPTLDGLFPDTHELNEVIARGMAKDPEQRFATAGGLMAAAVQALEQANAAPREVLDTPEDAVSAASVDTEPPAVDFGLTEAPVAVDEAPEPVTEAPVAVDEAPEPVTEAPVPEAVALGPAAEPTIVPHEAPDATEVVSRQDRSAEAQAHERTTADVRREQPVRAPQPERKPRRERPARKPVPASVRRRRRTALGLVGAVVVVVVVAAVSLGGGSSTPKTPQLLTATSAPWTIRYSGPWHPGAPLTSVGIQPTLTLTNGAATLSAGTADTEAPVPGQLPPSLASQFGPPSTATAAVISGDAGRQYAWAARSGFSSTALVVPTTRADLVILCRLPVATTPAAARSCAQMAAGASLSGVSVLPPGPDVALAKQLDAILGPLDRVRGTNAGLSGSSLRARAPAATKAAHADSSAAGALTTLAAPSRNEPAVQALAGALRTEASELTSLARAAGAGNRSGYAAARQRVTTASRRVSAAASALVAQRLPQALPALTVPGLPPLPRPKPHAAPSSTAPTYTPPPTTTYGGGGGGTTPTPTGGGGGGGTVPPPTGGGGGGGGGTITTPFG